MILRQKIVLPTKYCNRKIKEFVIRRFAYEILQVLSKVSKICVR